MHEKMIIMDDRTLIVGSYNPTKNANTLNDENLLIIRNNKELLTKAIGEFNRIMNEAKT
jgi:phosphatidylserine/phosphatidylglycerophosphate/cardiolipin synthase-like enzyme